MISIKKLIFFFTIVYFTISQLEISSYYYINNIVIIILNFLMVVFFVFNYNEKLPGARLFVLYIFIIPIVFFAFGNNYGADFYRINIFLSFLFLFSFYSLDSILLKKVIKYVTNFYFILAITIIADVLSFFLFGNSIFFNVIFYITPRFSGPFVDPNFMGFAYGGLFILSYLDKDIKRRYVIVYGLCCLFSGSWVAIGFVALILAQTKFFLIKKAYIKPLLCLSLIILNYIVYEYYLDELYDVFKYLVMSVSNMDEQLINIKFSSLSSRLEVTHMALDLILSNPFGYGYRTITQYLPLDTHNSFMGITFEYGVFSLLMIILPFLLIKKNNSRIIDALSSYICIVAVFLNIHYMPIYAFLFVSLSYYSKIDNTVEFGVSHKMVNI